MITVTLSHWLLNFLPEGVKDSFACNIIFVVFVFFLVVIAVKI